MPKTFEKFRDIFQSTPPRGWRRSSLKNLEAGYTISIHSTARVETELVIPLEYWAGISIHSTARVETRLSHPAFPSMWDFNPLHREGGDSNDAVLRAINLIISIHSTARVETVVGVGSAVLKHISIHSTARVETEILHNNHYYSSSHFHKQIISHPPQITANHPCTLANPFSLCKFSGANPPVNPCLLQVRTKILYTALPPAARSEYQRFFHINPLIHPNMVHFCSVFIPKVVKPKAVRLFINYICQYRL